jgi:hypothetical protein
LHRSIAATWRHQEAASLFGTPEELEKYERTIKQEISSQLANLSVADFLASNGASARGQTHVSAFVRGLGDPLYSRLAVCFYADTDPGPPSARRQVPG